MDRYTIDAVAFLAYLADALPTGANAIFSAAEKHEAMLLIPEIALGEVFYTIYKGKEVFGKKIPLQTIDEIMQTIAFDDAFSPAPMDLEAWQQFHKLPISELHDRMIAATTIASGAIALVTDDPEIAKCVPTIWN